ncbi:MAG: DUF2007 domain-containing protein [Polyangiaceae bacterium]|jgi:hypothetical protein
MPQDELVTVATFKDLPEAQLAQERLELEGVRAFVMDGQAGGVMPYLAESMGIRLQVEPKDAEKAKEILGS